MSTHGEDPSKRLGLQHELTGGPLGIFSEEDKQHDAKIKHAVMVVYQSLKQYFPKLAIRHRSHISKREINSKLSSIDCSLGKVLYVENSNIRPDGGVIEVKDKFGKYRVVVVGESKHQGNDVEKIKSGIKQGKNKDADLMYAGNAIERVHKNILEFRNFMMGELHFPYVVFLQGSNFATKSFFVRSPDGREVEIAHDSGNINRIDRVTASNFGKEINQNYCKNEYVELAGNRQMLQSASLFFQANPWTLQEMTDILWSVIETSFDVLTDDLIV